jgi:intracellular sulfur oxidation DsrE/DsrF family protein
MKTMTRYTTYTFFALALMAVSLDSALAGGTRSQPCPVGLVSGMTLDDEFGPGTSDITRCLAKREDVKVMFQVNQLCGNGACSRAYALHNIKNALDDYEITHGMKIGKDVHIAAIVHSGGFPLILNNGAGSPHATTNPFQADMEELIRRGVEVYFCQNTARSNHISTDQLVPGVQYVTSGVTAIADFQQIGWSYVQP